MKYVVLVIVVFSLAIVLTSAIAQVDCIESRCRTGREQLQKVIRPVFGCGYKIDAGRTG
jgi:hypothetical protein